LTELQKGLYNSIHYEWDLFFNPDNDLIDSTSYYKKLYHSFERYLENLKKRKRIRKNEIRAENHLREICIKEGMKVLEYNTNKRGIKIDINGILYRVDFCGWPQVVEKWNIWKYGDSKAIFGSKRISGMIKYIYHLHLDNLV
jgi:hypothetical protein